MVSIIIPFRNSLDNWVQIASGLQTQSRLPDAIYLVLDRCESSITISIRKHISSWELSKITKVLSVTKIPEYIGNPLDHTEASIFLAGHCRNLAVEQAIKDGHDTFIFIDGDCVPERDLVDSHLSMNTRALPNLSIGRRRDMRHGWKDQREIDPSLINLNLFGLGNGRVINKKELIASSSIVWTCNTSINKQAVDRISTMNEYYYGRRELFNSQFAGSWGGEDGFLGIQALMCSIPITVLTDEFSGIRHIDHPRPAGKYDPAKFKAYFNTQIALLDEMIDNKPMVADQLV